MSITSAANRQPAFMTVNLIARVGYGEELRAVPGEIRPTFGNVRGTFTGLISYP
jgi:hypothetical protein